MEPFAPEISQYWLQGREPAPTAANDADAEAAARAEEKALEELAERVSAARAIA